VGVSLTRAHLLLRTANGSSFNRSCIHSNFALSAGFVFVRMIKLLLVSAIYIGRVDRQFLSEGVGRLGCFELDNYPRVHTKDLLSNEAHRHPYLELLGVVYLMKLRHADGFGSSAGSAWRLLFVYSLFPWLNSYRLCARPKLMYHVREALTDTRRNSSILLNFTSLKHLGLKMPEKLMGDSGDENDYDTNANSTLPQSVLDGEGGEREKDETIRSLREEVRRLSEQLHRLSAKDIDTQDDSKSQGAFSC